MICGPNLRSTTATLRRVTSQKSKGLNQISIIVETGCVLCAIRSEFYR